MAFYANQPLPDTNARGASITMRPSSTALLTIDSEDRYTDYIQARAAPTSPYNYTIRKNENLMAGFFTRLAVTEVNFPWTIPNINNKTSSMVYTVGLGGVLPPGTPTTISGELVIPYGFYTPSALAAEIQTLLRSYDTSGALAAFEIQYSSTTGFDPAFIYATQSPTVTIAFSPLTANTSQYPYSPLSKQLFDLLGFSNLNGIPTAGPTNGGYTLCQAIRYVDIVCNQLTSVATVKDQTSQPVVRDMLCRVYLGDGGGTGQSTTPANAVDYVDGSGTITNAFCPPGCAPFTIYRNFTFPKQIQWIPNQNIPGFLQFQVYDDAGDLLDTSIIFTPQTANLNTNWSMTMLVTEN